jgi:hypothetical protein
MIERKTHTCGEELTRHSKNVQENPYLRGKKTIPAGKGNVV